MTIQLVLADEQPIYLLGLRSLLSCHPEFQIVATCTTGEETLRAVQEHRPDLLVLDLHLPPYHASDLFAEIQSAGLSTKTVLLTAHLDEDDAIKLIRLGLRGMVLKNMPQELVVKCMQKVHAGGEWLEKRAVSLALEKLLNRESERKHLDALLSVREIELMRLVGEGLPSRGIADRLCISEGTVKSHLHRIYRKLDVRNRVELINFVRDRGWAS